MLFKRLIDIVDTSMTQSAPKSMPLQTPIQNKDPSISTTFGVSTIGTFSIALSCPQPHVPSSIPRKKEQQR